MNVCVFKCSDRPSEIFLIRSGTCLSRLCNCANRTKPEPNPKIPI